MVELAKHGGHTDTGPSTASRGGNHQADWHAVSAGETMDR
jgi:hypothetical protein